MSQPQCVRSLDGFVFAWPDLPFRIELSRIKESSRATSGELQVKYIPLSGTPTTITHQTFNLLTSKTKLAKELQSRHEAPWPSMLEQVCVLTLRQLRQGEPIESLQPTQEDSPAWFVVNPLLYEKNCTILYGPGDSMKSYFCLYVGLLLASGKSGPLLSVAPDPWKVLFLDWEMSVQDVRGRVKMLQAGDDRLTGMPDYRRCYQPLADDVSELKKVVSEGGYDVLIIDSLAMAAGGTELEKADSAIRFNAALRSLNCTSLVIGHTPKPNEEQKERSLYGSVFFHNLCRNSWECWREGQTLALHHRKHNLGPEHDPLGFTLEIDGTTCRITEANISDEATSLGLYLQDQIANELKARPMQTPREIADMIGSTQAVVRAKLNALKSKRFISIDGKWELIR